MDSWMIYLALFLVFNYIMGLQTNQHHKDAQVWRL